VTSLPGIRRVASSDLAKSDLRRVHKPLGQVGSEVIDIPGRFRPFFGVQYSCVF
jgi:hypothetical protein